MNIDTAITTSWWPTDLRGLLSGDVPVVVPTLLTRSDGVHLLYPGKTHSLASEPEAGKSWIGLLAAHQTIAAGRHALLIDFEDSAETAVARLLALGAEPDAVAARFHYIAPQEPLDDDGRLAIEHLLELDLSLAVIDGLTEGFGLFGLDLGNNSDAATFMAALPRPIANAGPAVLMLDHLAKNRDTRGRFSLGAGHKLGALTGAAYQLETITPFGRDRRGMSKLTIVKDRPGRIRGHCVGGKFAAELHLVSAGDQVDAELRAPETAADGFKPTALMEKVSRLLETVPEGLTGNQIETAHLGKAAYVRDAVTALVNDGYVNRALGKRGALIHTPVKPFRNEH